MGAVVWVGQLPHGGLADVQHAGELDLGDALGPHGRVQGEFGGDAGRRVLGGGRGPALQSPLPTPLDSGLRRNDESGAGVTK